MVCSPASPSSFDPRVPTQMTRQDREVNAMWQAPSGPVLIAGDFEVFRRYLLRKTAQRGYPQE